MAASAGSYQAPQSELNAAATGLGGQRLARDTAGKPAFAAAPGDVPFYVPGGSYVNIDNRFVQANLASNVALPVGGMLYVPLWMPRPVPINNLSVYVVTVTTSGPLWLSVNLMDPATAKPAGILGSNLTVTPTLSGAIAATLPVVVPAGWCYLGVGSDAAASLTIAGNTAACMRTPLANLPGTGPSAAGNFSYWTGTGPPSSGPAVTATSAVGTPLLWLTAAA